MPPTTSRVVAFAAGALAVLSACSARPLSHLELIPDAGSRSDRPNIGWGDPTIPSKLDLLFLIDDSAEMQPAQQALIRSLPAFFDVLKGLPLGLPSLHVAVITSDLGAGNGEINGCLGNGDSGVFRARATGDCGDTTLVNGATYVITTGGTQPQTNFTAPDITQVVQCLAAVGDTGCGFEHQLASVARALGADGAAPPLENQGFLRPDAMLAIVLLTSEDDCSAPVDSALYEVDVNTNLASVVGPPANFRCNEWGHRCGDPSAKPPRLSPNPTDLSTTVTLDGCTSADTPGFLTPVAKLVQGIRALKPAPDDQIFVVSIQGPSTPYTIHWKKAPLPDTGPWPEIQHACVGADPPITGDPGVRLAEFTAAFGESGILGSICDPDYAHLLTPLASKLSKLQGG